MSNRELPNTRRRTAGLTRQHVLLEAIALVDEHGPAALSMRALASRLGVQAMSLYHYVRNREELLDGIAEILVSTLPLSQDDATCADAVRAFAIGIRAVATSHPRAFQLVGMRPLATTSALQPVGALLHRLHSAGMPPDDAVVVYRATAAFARGFALAEIAGFTLADSASLPGSSDAADLQPFRAALSGSQGFDAALQVLIDGVRAYLPTDDHAVAQGPPTTHPD